MRYLVLFIALAVMACKGSIDDGTPHQTFGSLSPEKIAGLSLKNRHQEVSVCESLQKEEPPYKGGRYKGQATQAAFLRGDLNNDGVVSLEDHQVGIGNTVYNAGSLPCPAVADANADGCINTTDVNLFAWLGGYFNDGKEQPFQFDVICANQCFNVQYCF